MSNHKILNERELKTFLKNDTNELNYLTVAVKAGTRLELKGIKWLSGLTIYTRGSSKEKTTVVFPDLRLIAGDLDLSSASNIQLISFPKLTEVRGDVHEVDASGDMKDFDSVDGGTLKIHAPRIKLDGVATVDDDVINLANDRWYILQYHVKSDKFTAGCRTFKSIDVAIKHWNARYEEQRYSAYNTSRCGSNFYSETAHRALMFIFALENFKLEMEAGLSEDHQY